MNLRGDILTQRCNYILDSPILSNLILCLVAWSLIQGSCNSRLCQCDIVSHPTKHLRAGPSQKIKKTLNTCGRGPPGIYIYTCELASCACRLVIFYFLILSCVGGGIYYVVLLNIDYITHSYCLPTRLN